MDNNCKKKKKNREIFLPVYYITDVECPEAASFGSVMSLQDHNENSAEVNERKMHDPRSEKKKIIYVYIYNLK